jgi:hypothetical protein
VDEAVDHTVIGFLGVQEQDVTPVTFAY